MVVAWSSRAGRPALAPTPSSPSGGRRCGRGGRSCRRDRRSRWCRAARRRAGRATRRHALGGRTSASPPSGRPRRRCSVTPSTAMAAAASQRREPARAAPAARSSGRRCRARRPWPTRTTPAGRPSTAAAISAAGEVGLVVGVGPDRQDRAQVGRRGGHGVGSSVWCRRHATEQHPIAAPLALTRSRRAPAAVSARERGARRIVIAMTRHHQPRPDRPRARAARPTCSSASAPGPASSTAPTPTSTRTSPSSASSATSPPPCPPHLGGWGWSLGQLAAQPAAPRPLRPGHRAGDDHALLLDRHRRRARARRRRRRCAGSSRRVVAGDVFAAGHAETGNDIPVLLSTCQAERVEGGYRLTGRKQFGSNGPVWRWLGAHAIDADAPGGPQIVHAFVERTSPGVTVVETWDTLGMRPTPEPRHDPRRRVRARRAHRPRRARRATATDLFLVGDEHVGAAAHRQRVPRHRRPGARAGRRRRPPQDVDRHRAGAYAYNPMVQHQVAEMYLELDAARRTRRPVRRRLGGRRRPRRRRGRPRCSR